MIILNWNGLNHTLECLESQLKISSEVSAKLYLQRVEYDVMSSRNRTDWVDSPLR